MKPEFAFVADRAIARHSPELLSAGPPPVELGPQLARCGERMARLLATALAPLCGDEAPVVRLGSARDHDAGELAVTIEPLAANALYAFGAPHHRLLGSVEADPVLRMVDRAFGGRGRAPDPLPDAFPLSAELMIARIEGIIASVAGQAFGGKEPLDVRPIERSDALAEICPFAEGSKVTSFTLDVEESSGDTWTITICAPPAVFEHVFGHAPAEKAGSAATAMRSPVAEPFADMPMSLSALIIDTRMPFSALAALEVGQVLPVSVSRQVPIIVGDRCIARGTVGAIDDRVAVQLTQVFEN